MEVLFAIPILAHILSSPLTSSYVNILDVNQMKTVGLIQTTLLIMIDYSIILYEEHLISYKRCKRKVSTL